MGEPTVLCFNLNDILLGQVQALCGALGVTAKTVPAADFGMPVGALAGLPMAGHAAAPVQGFDDPMLVMCFLEQPQFDGLLQGLRFSGIRIDLKAVLTPTNAAWNARQLRDELLREHEQMRKR